MLLLQGKVMRNKKSLLFLILLFLSMGLTILLDFLHAKIQHSAFYFSESLLFSSFWGLFLPLLYAQYVWAARITTVPGQGLLVAIPIIAHLLAYPALIWLLSSLFYDQAFRYVQTLQFALTNYLIQLLIIYAAPYILYINFKNRLRFYQHPQTNGVSTFIVTEADNRRVSIDTNDIVYFSANPPYINIHHKNKKYLYKDTLKSIIAKVNGERFVRIHKSTIVNIDMVRSYKSRLNGDYDLTLNDGAELRISRKYAADFKSRLEKRHRLASK